MAYEITTDKVKIATEKVTESRIGEVDFENIVFGRTFTDHMFVTDFDGTAWQQPRIVPFGPLSLSPATTALHYGQAIFEGLKAYMNKEGEPVLFRPDANFHRLNHSARRMCMPELPEDLFMQGLKELVALDRKWIPTREGSSLYIRPFMFSTDEYVGIKPSDTYKFIIFCCPVNSYYPEPIKVKIEEYYSRAASGGTGEAKNAGNYGASLYPAALAQKEGYKQLIWTDGKEHKYIEESGTMNVFFVIDDTVITPGFNGNILHGVTRDSAVTLLREKGFKVEERPITVDEVVSAMRSNRVREVFGTGTAATIAHITGVGYRDEEFELPPVETREVSNWLMETLDGIRRGRIGDKHGWIVRVDE